jgi:CheY-like chemotaxis protein
VTLRENAAGASLKGKRILVCDDEPFNRILASHVLKSYGAEVLEAGDGKEAIAVLEKEHVDLVMMDMQMPGMSGAETVKLIRASGKPSYSNVKVIAVTGRANPGEMEKCLEAGMNSYLAKPYKEEQLIAAIIEVMSAGASA